MMKTAFFFHTSKSGYVSQNHRKEREKLIEIIGGSQCKNGKVKGLVNINRINLIKDQKKKRKNRGSSTVRLWRLGGNWTETKIRPAH